jgi:hypothetical protein
MISGFNETQVISLQYDAINALSFASPPKIITFKRLRIVRRILLAHQEARVNFIPYPDAPMKKIFLSALITALVVVCITPVQAQYTLYRNTNDFFNALASTNYATETFAALTPGFVGNPQNFTNSPYGFQANIPGSSFISVESYGGKPALATVVAGQSMVFTNFSPNTRAFGAYLYATDVVILSQPITISLVLSTGPVTPFTTNVGTTDLSDYFFGFIADDPLTIQSLSLSVTNNLAFATASEVTISSVPEPSTYTLLGMGAVALVGYLFRRRRA